MTETNLNIVLSNALCCSSQLAAKVSKLYNTGNLCVDTEFDKLKLLIDKIETLKCYNFPIITIVPNTNSEFFTTLSNTQFSWLSEIYYLNIQLNVNGTIYTIISNDINTGFELIENKLLELGILIFFSNDRNSVNLILTCDILNISFTIQYGEELPSECLFTNTIPGICSSTIITPVENCLTEEQADIMMHDVMRQCGICDCQLTT